MNVENGSLWINTVGLPCYPAWNGDREVDVAVIGGGLAGILTAHFLEQAGRKCVVLEADRIGSGQTKNTTAKVTSQHGLIYGKLMRTVGRDMAQQYADANREAIERYRILIRKYGIECEWETCGAYLYGTEKERELREEYRAAVELGISARMIDHPEKTELPFPAKKALLFERQARFHPLKFLERILDGLEIYERTRVLRVDGRTLITDRGSIKANQIVFATHYPFLNMPGYYFLRMHQERSYVIGLEHGPRIQNVYLGVDPNGLSLRQAGNFLLLGGGNHRTGDEKLGDPYEALKRAAEQYFPQASVRYAWSAQDCMTLDGIPYIGKFGKQTDHWFVATGFQKWGMTTSMAAATILTDLMCGRKNRYADVFSPQRKTMLASAKTFCEEGAYAVVNLTKELFAFPKEKLEDIRPGTGGTIEYEGKKVGVYKTEEEDFYFVSVKCPHLGCQLSWNQAEKSLDCPCHGSRYDYSGKLLDGPAQTASVACSLQDPVKGTDR